MFALFLPDSNRTLQVKSIHFDRAIVVVFVDDTKVAVVAPMMVVAFRQAIHNLVAPLTLAAVVVLVAH